MILKSIISSLHLKIVFIFIVLFFINSCTKNKPTEPEEKEPLDTDYILITDEVIGPEGGEIVADELTLTIPQGAFNSSSEINILASEIDKPFEDNHASKSYRFEGIPQVYNKPLKFSIKYNSVSSSNENLLVLGEEVLNSGEYGYRFLESADSSGYVVGELPIPDQDQEQIGVQKITTEGKFVQTISIISGYTSYLSAKGHFLISLPLAHTNNINKLAEFLEEAYQKILDMGFNYDARTNWPLNVTLRKFNEGLDALTATSKLGDNYGFMELNENLLDNLPHARVTAGHEFFHVVQSFYDARWHVPFIGKGYTPPNHYWLNEATAAWIEEKFTDIVNYSPAVRNGNSMAPLKGMQMDPYDHALDFFLNKDVQDHGYGLSAVIKYLVDRSGEKILLKMYEDIKNEKHAVEAVSQTDPNEWWEHFLQEYILSKVYNDVPAEGWIGTPITGRFQVSSSSDVVTTFTESYQDLSGNLFFLRLGFPEINPNSAAIFNISGASKRYLSLLKYSNTSKSLELLASDYNTVIVNDLKGLTSRNEHLLALVSNNRYSSPYTSQHEIRLEIKIEDVFDIFNSKNCDLGLGDVVANTLFSDGRTGEWILNKGWEAHSGNWNGNTFSGTSTGGYDDTISVTIDPSTREITSFFAKYSDAYEELIIEGNFQIEPNTNGNYYTAVYLSNGVDVCGNISNIRFLSYNWGTTISGYTCNSASELELRFWE